MNSGIKPVYFGHGQAPADERLNGRLAPELARVHKKAVAAEEVHIAGLQIGECFSVRYIRTREGLRAVIEPKRIDIT